MRELLRRCVDEDGGIDGDVTTQSIISSELQGNFALNIRGLGTIAGLDPIAGSIDFFKDISMELLHHDGEEVKNANIAIIEGPVASILLAEPNDIKYHWLCFWSSNSD